MESVLVLIVRFSADAQGKLRCRVIDARSGAGRSVDAADDLYAHLRPHFPPDDADERS